MDPPPPPPAPLASLLEPWLDTLRTLQLRPVTMDLTGAASASTADLSDGGVWLKWTLPRDTSRVRRCVEAVELFVLLAWADSDAWRGVAESLRDTYYKFRVPAPSTRVIGYAVGCGHERETRAFCELLSRSVAHHRSGYHHVREVLETVMRKKISGGATVEIPVRLGLQVDLPRRTPDDGTLAAIVSLVKFQRVGEADDVPMTCNLAGFRSRVRCLYDDDHAMTTIEEENLAQLATIWACGVPVFDLPRMQLTIWKKKRDACMAAHHRLLGVGCDGSVRRAVVGQARHRTETVALLTAVAHSSSIREVIAEFEQPREDEPLSEHRVVQWMAYALFSTHATNAVTKLSLRCRNLTVAHVNMMRELLTADDPLEVLFPEFAESIRAHGDLRVSASRLYLDDRASDTRSNDCARSVIDLEDLRVLTQSERWWRVFAPGCGQAWVQIDQAVVSQVAFAAPNTNIRPIAEIHFSDFQAENEAPMLALLDLVGSGVRVIEIVDRNRSIDRLSPGVFDACPDLEEFKLCESVPEQLDVFVGSFVDRRCRRLKRLDIQVELVTEAAMQHVQQLFETLADPNHIVAHQLEGLSVNTFCMIDGGDVLDSDMPQLVLRMLQANKRLTHLWVNLPLAARDMNAVQRLSNEFAKHHDVLLPTPIAPLGPREKAAFLSVVWSDASHARSAASHFDRRIVSTIFEFVPDRRKREVFMKMPIAFVEEEHW